MASIKIKGDTSGSTTITAPATGSDETIELSTALASKLDSSAYTAPGLVHIHTEAISAAGSTSINNVFTSTYDNYMLVLSGTASTSTSGRVRWRVSGSDNTENQYIQSGVTIDDTSLTGFRTTTTSIGLSAVDSSYNLHTFHITNVAKAEPTLNSCLTGTRMNATATATSQIRHTGHNVSTAYDGLTFFLDAGTYTGTIRIYGYVNS